MLFFSQYFCEQLQPHLPRGALWCLAGLLELFLGKQTVVKLGRFGYTADLLLWGLHRYLLHRHIWSSQTPIMVNEEQQNPPGSELSNSNICIFKACYCLLSMN